MSGIFLSCALLTEAGMYAECGTFNPVKYVREKRRKNCLEYEAREKRKQETIEKFKHEQYLLEEVKKITDTDGDEIFQAGEIEKLLTEMGCEQEVEKGIPYNLSLTDESKIRIDYSHESIPVFWGKGFSYKPGEKITSGSVYLPKSKLEEFLDSR
jgi:hypothetical protein